ncbi:hypothetical protein ACQ4WP_26945 [Janthinobacterium sp. GB4P2]|uniref:hypothetical protein n=1 Tax=Janthinobacterium sp. GB4P2 TaxID=3424189 RepID=UPI003F1EF030
MTPTHPMTVRRTAAITAALRDQALTIRDLAARVFLEYEQTRRYVAHLHADGTVHIARWTVQTAGRETRLAVYKLGAGRDAPRPARLTGTQRQANHILRIRDDADLYDRHKARSRARKLKPARDPMVSALFGAARVQEVAHG